MDCTQCRTRFNSDTNCPKILPCLELKCMACLQRMPKMQNEFLVECTACGKTHPISNINDMPTSDFALHLAEQPEEQAMTASVLDYTESLPQRVNAESYEVYKHYDNIICDIAVSYTHLTLPTILRV